MITGKIRQKLTQVTIRPWLGFRIWFVPLVLALLLVTGWWIRHAMTESVKQRMASGLTVILDSNVEALEIWLRELRAYVDVLTQSEQVRRPVIELARAWSEDPGSLSVRTEAGALERLRRHVVPLVRGHDFEGFVLVAPDGTVLAEDLDDAIGTRIAPERIGILGQVLAGRTVVSHPFVAGIPVPDADGVPRSRIPIMVVAGPVRDERGRVIAALALRIDPETDFTRILRGSDVFESGETYAFDARGLMISHSRFEEQLRASGLIPTEGRSLLTLEIRDPGGNLLEGFEPEGKGPLTRMAASAVTGERGVDVEGYRDYRGVKVVGAWEWLDEYGFGVATEMDHAEALAIPAELRRIFWTVIALFVLGSAAVLAGTAVVSRLGRQMTDALREAQRLGQYTLEEKLGEGGMGQVFRARHAMLRRPTAIKLLHPDRASPRDLARFEREVQVTSRLTHPNTIAIYDFGRTPEGVFYYAMEYLPGIDLGKLVRRDGAQPEARVIHILRQVCGSLAEAHENGLIHRDIKPENVILCERGGRHDVVKVLDFGIVKETEGGAAVKLTRADSFTGTPLYVPPEAWATPDKVDGRADIYAIGAVAYLLLSGEALFEADTVVEYYNHHVGTQPVPPSRRSGLDISTDLEQVVMACLEKDRNERPQTARELAAMLEACRSAGDWTEEQARRWWDTHAGATETAGSSEPSDRPPTTEIPPTVVVDAAMRTRDDLTRD